jgi:hypothetical protein
MAVRGGARGITPEEAAHHRRVDRKREQERQREIAELERIQREAEERQRKEWDEQQAEKEKQQREEAKASEQKQMQDFLETHPAETHYIVWRDGRPHAYEVPDVVHEHGGRDIWEMDVKRVAYGLKPIWYDQYLKSVGKEDIRSQILSDPSIALGHLQERVDVRTTPSVPLPTTQPDLRIKTTPTQPQKDFQDFKPWEIQHVVDEEGRRVGLDYLKTLPEAERIQLARQYIAERPHEFVGAGFKERDPRIYAALEPGMITKALDLLQTSPEEYSMRYYDTRPLHQQIAISAFPALTGTVVGISLLPLTIAEEVGGRIFTGKPVEIIPIRRPISEFLYKSLQTGPGGLIGTGIQYGVGRITGQPEDQYARAWERTKQHPIPALFATVAEIVGIKAGGAALRAEFLVTKKVVTTATHLPTSIKTFHKTKIPIGGSRTRGALEFIRDTRAEQPMFPILATKQKISTPYTTAKDVIRDPSILFKAEGYQKAIFLKQLRDPVFIGKLKGTEKVMYDKLMRTVGTPYTISHQPITTTALMQPRTIGVSARMTKAQEYIKIQKVYDALKGQRITAPSEEQIFKALKQTTDFVYPTPVIKTAPYTSISPYITTTPHLRKISKIISPQPFTIPSKVITASTLAPILLTKAFEATKTKEIEILKPMEKTITKTIPITATITKADPMYEMTAPITATITKADPMYEMTAPITATITKTDLMYDTPPQLIQTTKPPQQLMQIQDFTKTKLKLPLLPDDEPKDIEDMLKIKRRRAKRRGARYRIHPVELMRIV